MLKRLRSGRLLPLLLLALVSPPALAQDDNLEGDLHRPERLTVGVADDLLGQLSADGKTLYYVSTINTTSQLFSQDLRNGRSKQLFDDNADITWPRVSPDGKQLLYISFREQASGRLCVRSLPDAGQRRCFEDGSAALQAEWIDANRIALVVRQAVHGDLRVLDLAVDGAFRARPLLDRNLTSPAVSKDGRWMVYVPVSRSVENVGPAFAAHAAAKLEVQRLGLDVPPIQVTLDLPGLTGQPAFARDGRSIYIVQFSTDNNHDGVVDAGDHGVLFRIPISFDSGAPVLGPPLQLTETSWNCQYPAPAADRLILTCSEDGSLDVYALPLDGEVPADWSSEALGAALLHAPSHVAQQLLASRRLAKETTPTGKRRAMLTLAMVHLEEEEFRAAEFYATLIHTLRDPATAGISTPLRILVEQRRAARRREQGRMMEGFATEARARLERLRPEAFESPMAEDLIHLVRSEIQDSLGDKGAAKKELDAVTVDETTPQPIVEAYYQAADALYRELDDREALVLASRQLAANKALSPDEQLRYARATVRSMVHGLPYDEAVLRLTHERSIAGPDEAELVFAIDLGRAVLAVRDAHAEKRVIDALLDLYGAQTRPGRRRALMSDAVRRASELNADRVLEALAQRDVEDVKRGTAERPLAERFYRKMMLGRAYRRSSEGRYDEARADFEAVARETRSYEAIVGAIDVRLTKGERSLEIEASYEQAGATPVIAHFAKAYLLARRLPELEGDAHAKAAASALSALDSSWSELKGQRMAHALYGSLLHEDFLQTNDLATAETANVHYLIALELVGQNARFRAMILGELGLLQADVANYRIALTYLEDRDKLPYSDNAEGLDVLLSKAQSLLHVGRDGDAADAGDRALVMIARAPALSPHRLLALDWAAVANLSAGRFERALALYAEEIPLLAVETGPFAERNRMVARISRAAAAVGAGKAALAIPDLDYLESRLGDAKVAETLTWPHATPAQVVATYRLILAGLRASAFRELGKREAEAGALEERLAILAETFRETRRGEVVREEMLTETQLATNANDRHDAARTGRWLASALSHADDLHSRAHGVASRDQLDVLWLASQLTLSTHATLIPDLRKRIDAASSELAKRRDPSLLSYRERFETYLTVVSPVVPAEGSSR